jgi:glycerol-3-phosphate dehydrogenase (NAD(P)+)
VNAVIGAGAMGAALAMVHARAGVPTTLLGTRFDDATIDAVKAGRAHPALGITLPPAIDCRRSDSWGAVLRNAERIVLGISSDGLADVVSSVAPQVRANAVWTIATKGWDPDTLRTPSEVVTDSGGRRVVVLAGPALAPELVAAAPTAMVCASSDGDAAASVAATLRAAGVAASVTDDVPGAEVAAAYKNVTAIAVGMCEGLSERVPESVFIHRFANARAATFALGLRDMCRLAERLNGRIDTIIGLAGAGDLYVTCLGGRNGNLGRLLGAGQTPEQAQRTIGSTVEGVANTTAALELADKLGVELVAARVVDAVLRGELSPAEAIERGLASLASV